MEWSGCNGLLVAMVMLESNIEICDNEDVPFDVAAGSLVDGLSVDINGNPVEVTFPPHRVTGCVNETAYQLHELIRLRTQFPFHRSENYSD